MSNKHAVVVQHYYRFMQSKIMCAVEYHPIYVLIYTNSERRFNE